MLKLARTLINIELPIVRYVPKEDDYKIVWSSTTGKLFEEKSLLLGITGCFFPTVTEKFLPEYFSHTDELKALGEFQKIIVVGVNDPHTMKVFAEEIDAEKEFDYLCDFNGEFVKSLDATVESEHIGLRSKIFRGIVEKGNLTSFVKEDSWRLTKDTRVFRLLYELSGYPPYPDSLYNN